MSSSGAWAAGTATAVLPTLPESAFNASEQTDFTADANGNVFHQGMSDGSMFVWNGCDAKGNRVKTGVYYVLASQKDNGSASSSSSCVTKIMVVN